MPIVRYLSLKKSTLFKYIFILVSNPPPSPVTDGNRENSSDFDSHDIRHHVVNVTSPEKATMARDEPAMSPPRQPLRSVTATAADNGYEEDFLDMHCDDMDLF